MQSYAPVVFTFSFTTSQPVWTAPKNNRMMFPNQPTNCDGMGHPGAAMLKWSGAVRLVSALSALVACLFVFFCGATTTLAADEAPTELEPAKAVPAVGSFPVKIVAGRLVARVEISTPVRRIPVNLFIEFGTTGGLRLHKSMSQPLGLGDPGEATNPITVNFPEFAITEETYEKGSEEEYNEFTRLNSREINEEALVGSIGAKILNRYRVTLDLREGLIELSLPGKEESSGGEAADRPTGEEEVKMAITMTKDLVWLPIQVASGKVHAMAVSTSRYDSLIDAPWCKQLGFPAGDVGLLKLGGIDLASFVAFRPEPMANVHPDLGIGVIGLNLLKHLRLTLDPGSKTAVCRVTAPPDFPVGDRVFFKALVTGEADEFEAYLTTYPKERLSGEAALLLLDQRLAKKGTPGQIESAIRRLRVTWREDMISTLALDLMRRLLTEGHPMQAVLAGELGIEGGRKDTYPNSAHQLHATMGEILLDQNEDQRAWRHLLSAAFGIPEDGPVNLNLGRFYEKQKRDNRAMSRYVQALIKVETGEKALEGLARVLRKLGDPKPLSVDTIAPLISGKTYNYSAPTRYEPVPNEETNRVSLVEFFTNTHYKKPDKEEGSIGGALANEGVMTFFPRGKVAMLTYHLANPALDLDSLVNELAENTAEFYRVPPTVQLVNGTAQFPGEGHLTKAEGIFQQGRDVILASLKEKSDFKLKLTSAIEGGRITGSLEVTDLTAKGAAKNPPTVHIVLAERGVIYTGKSKVVIQRMVARAALTEQLRGVPFETKNGLMVVPFSQSLDAITQANLAYLKKLETSGAGKAQAFAAKMDARQLTLVAFVRDGASKEILQAIQIEPTLPPETKPATSP